MITADQFREFALSLPNAIELPHFEKASFRVNKKIFASLSEPDRKATLKFSEVDQNVFSAMAKTIIYPVPNKWGQQGWTVVELDRVDPGLLADALKCSYNEVLKKK